MKRLWMVLLLSVLVGCVYDTVSEYEVKCISSLTYENPIVVDTVVGSRMMINSEDGVVVFDTVNVQTIVARYPRTCNVKRISIREIVGSVEK